MSNEKKFYNEPEMNIIYVFANGDVVTLSQEGTGKPDSEGFDDILGNL